MLRKAYLPMAMLRRLLTCLAILTGLAAVSAPAQASLLDSLTAQLEQGEKADEDKRAESECVERQRAKRLRRDKPSPCEAVKPVRIYIPTVQFGPDRAFE